MKHVLTDHQAAIVRGLANNAAQWRRTHKVTRTHFAEGVQCGYQAAARIVATHFAVANLKQSR